VLRVSASPRQEWRQNAAPAPIGQRPGASPFHRHRVSFGIDIIPDTMLIPSTHRMCQFFFRIVSTLSRRHVGNPV